MFGQSGCVRAKVVVFRQTWLNSGKWLCSGKVVVFGQMWLYSGKGVDLRQKWLHLAKSGCIRAKVLVFGQKWIYSGKSGCNRTKWLYSEKVVVFGQK